MHHLSARLSEEPMTEKEVSFIQKTYRHESRIYLKTMNFLLVIGVFSPMALCLIVLFGKEVPTWRQMAIMYAVGLVFMLFFVGMIAVVSYRLKVRNYSRDNAALMKTIEKTHIKQKKAMPQNHSYHFYLDSPVQYTIEVSANDFDRWEIGDELNIEYAKHSKEYFGYF